MATGYIKVIKDGKTIRCYGNNIRRIRKLFDSIKSKSKNVGRHGVILEIWKHRTRHVKEDEIRAKPSIIREYLP